MHTDNESTADALGPPAASRPVDAFRVVLISPFDLGTFGLRTVCAHLKKLGIETHLILFGDRVIQDVPVVSERELAAVTGLVRDLRPQLVGLSVTSLFSHPAALAIAGRVKEVCNTPVVMGGPCPTLLPEFCLQSAAVDYVCVGEGEETMAGLCARLAAGDSPAGLPGLMARGADAVAGRPPRQDLDALPFPDIDPENKYFITADGEVKRLDPFRNTLNYATKCSRGCPFRCSYCSNTRIRELNGPGRAMRRRSPSHVLAELEQVLAVNPNCETISFWDDNFPYDRAWVAEFAAGYRERIGRSIFLWAHPQTILEENIAALAAAAPKLTVFVGIESGAPVTRRNVFFRTETNEEIRRADRVLSRPNILKTYDFIIEHPWESPTELEENFDLLESLQPPFQINMHNLFFLPRTALADRAVQEGVTTEAAMLDAILADPHQAARRIRWTRGIPLQSDPHRARWIFLIMCLGNPRIPRTLVRWLAHNRFLTRHPGLLTDLTVIDMQEGAGDFGAFVAELWKQQTGLGRWFARGARRESVLMGGCRRLPLLAWRAVLVYRAAARWKKTY